MTRQNYNLKIIELLKEKKFFQSFFGDNMASKMYETIEDCIIDFKDQRFGQIITNYIYPDYHHRNDYALNNMMDMLFYGCSGDPFFEESEETFNRLNI